MRTCSMRVILYPLAGLYIIEGGVARDKQDVRDRRDSKFWVRSSENLELRTSNRHPSHPPRFSCKSRSSRSSRSRSRRLGAPSLGELCGNLREICLEPDHDQDIIDAEHEGIVGRHEKWSTKDRDETNRRRQCHLSECPPSDR